MFGINELLFGQKEINIDLKGLTDSEKKLKIEELFLSDDRIYEISTIDNKNIKWKISRERFLNERNKEKLREE